MSPGSRLHGELANIALRTMIGEFLFARDSNLDGLHGRAQIGEGDVQGKNNVVRKTLR